MQVKNPQLKERIIESARKCFFETGYKKTSIGDIAKEGYTTNSNIYTYFDGKLDIFNHVIGDVPFLIDTYIAKYYRTAIKQFNVERNTIDSDKLFPNELIFNKKVSMTLHILFEGSKGTPYACYKESLYSILQDCIRVVLGENIGTDTVNLLIHSFVEKILAIAPKTTPCVNAIRGFEGEYPYIFTIVEEEKRVELQIFTWRYNMEMEIIAFWNTYKSIMSSIPVNQYTYIVDCRKMPIVFDHGILKEIVTKYYETHFKSVKYVFKREQIALSIVFSRLTKEIGHTNAEIVFEN